MSSNISETVFFLKSVFILTISATLLQFIPPANGSGKDFEWDLAMAHGDTVKLISTTGSMSELELKMQLPMGPLSGTTRARDQYLVLMSADPKRGLIFFSQIADDLTSIAVFNLSDNVTTLLYQSKNSSINGLVYHNDFLYWSDSRQKHIMTLNTTITTGISPQLVFSLNDSSIQGVAVNPITNVLYWANWSTDPSVPSSIFMYDHLAKTNKAVLSTNLYRPQGLFSDGTYLYWSDNPPGVYYHIERALLTNLRQREVLKRGENQHPFALTAVCSKTVYWTDRPSHSLLKMDIKSKETKMMNQYRGEKPFGLVSNILRKCDPVVTEREAAIANVTKTENISLVLSASSLVGLGPGNLKNNSDVMEWCGDWESIPCLNGASCLSVNRKVFCLCAPGFIGPTCQDKYVKHPEEEFTISPVLTLSLLGCLLGIVMLLVIVIIFLAVRVRKLNKKPKIHKKIVVARSRQRDQTSSSVCEMIDIENCCNMNVCETPCYDRIGPTSMVTKSEKKAANKDEDKQRLIDT